MDYLPSFNALMVTKRKALSAVRSSTKSSLKSSGTNTIGDKTKAAIVSIICNYTEGYLLNGFHPKLQPPPGKNGMNGITLGSNGLNLHNKEPFLKYMRSLEKTGNGAPKPIKKAKKRVSFGPSTVKIFSENDYFKGERAMLNDIAKEERCRQIHKALRKRTKDPPLIVSGRRSSFNSARTQIKRQVKRNKKRSVIASKVKKVPITLSSSKKPSGNQVKKAERNISGTCKDKPCENLANCSSKSNKGNSGAVSKNANHEKNSKRGRPAKEPKKEGSANESKKITAGDKSKNMKSGDKTKKQNAGTEPKKLNHGKESKTNSSGNKSKKESSVNESKNAKCGSKIESKKLVSGNDLKKPKSVDKLKQANCKNTNDSIKVTRSSSIKITRSCALKILAKVSREPQRSFHIPAKCSKNFPCLLRTDSNHFKILTGRQGRPFSVSKAELKTCKVSTKRTEKGSAKKDKECEKIKNSVGRPKKIHTENSKLCAKTLTGTNGVSQKKSNNTTASSKKSSSGVSNVKATIKHNSSVKETKPVLKRSKDDSSKRSKQSGTNPSESSKKNIDKQPSHPSSAMKVSKKADTSSLTKNKANKRPHEAIDSGNDKGNNGSPKKVTKPSSRASMNTSPRRQGGSRTRRKMLLRFPKLSPR